MIAEASLIACHWKLATSSLAVVVIAAADMTVAPGTLEDYGLKGLLIIAIVFVVRLLLKQQVEHKAELKEERTAHQTANAQREEKVVAAMNKQADALDRVASQVEEQTTYFKTVTRNIVDQHIQGPHKTIP